MLFNISRRLWIRHGMLTSSHWRYESNNAQQFLLAAGLQYEKSSRATNMVYMQMLFALTFDKLVWGTTPGTLSIIGSSLILGSAIYVAMKREDPKKNKTPREARHEDEERGLISPDILAQNREDDSMDMEIPLRSFR